MRAPPRRRSGALARLAGLAALVSLAVPAGASAQQAAQPFGVAVVVAGDPGPELRSQAEAVRDAVRARPELHGPADPGLARALAGEAPAQGDDGLEQARAERRRLGWNEARDVPVLARIGRMTGADLVLVVRRGATGAELVAFDVAAGAFYEGALVLPATPEALGDFALDRARAAATRPPGAEAPAKAAPAAAKPRAAPAAALAPDEEPKDEASTEPEKRWIAKNWPYLVAGALLAGTVTFFVVRSKRDQTPEPVLRFELGGAP